MAANPIPDALSQIFALAEDMIDGLHALEVAVGIKQNTEAALTAVRDAAQTAESDYGAAKGAKGDASTALRVADSNARAFLKAARAVLAQRLGELWSVAWEPTGFPDQSTAVPSTQDARLTLCASLKTYLTANPTQEVTDLNVTAAVAETNRAALAAARAAVNTANTTAGTQRDARDAAVDALKTAMRGLIAELGQKLSDIDPRWDSFGLNAPGSDTTPDAPEALVVTPGASGTLFVDWADARHAARYRVWLQVVGVDADFRAGTTVTDSDATLSALPSGKTVKVRVTAVSDTGLESVPSATVEAVVA